MGPRFTWHDRVKAEGRIESLEARLDSWRILEELGEDRHSEIVADRRELEKEKNWLDYVKKMLDAAEG